LVTLKKSHLALNAYNKKIKVWKRLGKVGPGRVREGNGILVR